MLEFNAVGCSSTGIAMCHIAVGIQDREGPLLARSCRSAATASTAALGGKADIPRNGSADAHL